MNELLMNIIDSPLFLLVWKDLKRGGLNLNVMEPTKIR